MTPPYNIPDYHPGRFAYLMKHAFADELWTFLTAETQLRQMLAAVAAGKPAIEPLLAKIESLFAECLSSTSFPPEEITVFINNMIRQIIEHQGYEHCACGICRGTFFKMSGVYRPSGTETQG